MMGWSQDVSGELCSMDQDQVDSIGDLKKIAIHKIAILVQFQCCIHMPSLQRYNLNNLKLKVYILTCTHLS